MLGTCARRVSARFVGTGVELGAVAVSALLTVSAAAVAAQPLLLLLLAMAPSSSSSSRWSSSAWSRWSAARALSLLRGVCALLLAAAALNAATLQQLLWSRFRHAPLGRSHSAAAQSAARPDHLRAGLLAMEARRTISEVQTMDMQAQALVSPDRVPIYPAPAPTVHRPALLYAQ